MFPHSVRTWVFWNPQSMQQSAWNLLVQFMLPPSDKRCGDAAFIFPAGFGIFSQSQKYQKQVQWPWCYWACWGNSLSWTLWEHIVIVKSRMRINRCNNVTCLKAATAAKWSSVTTVLYYCKRWIYIVLKAYDYG